jgi:hypothetical protein
MNTLNDFIACQAVAILIAYVLGMVLEKIKSFIPAK